MIKPRLELISNHLLSTAQGMWLRASYTGTSILPYTRKLVQYKRYVYFVHFA